MAKPHSLPPSISPSAGSQGRHVLAVPDGVSEADIFDLARWRFPRVTRLADTTMQFSRYAAVSAVHQATPAELAELVVPMDCPNLYYAHVRVERGAPPWDHHLEVRDPASLIFADGLPVRDEERIVNWFIDVARQVGGSLLLDGQPYRPDPQAGLGADLISESWLTPAFTAELISQLTPAKVQVSQGEPAASDEPVAYSISLNTGRDGWLVIDADLDPELPPIVTEFSPVPVDADIATMCYRIRWYPPDVQEIEVESDFNDGDWFGMEVLDGHLLDPAVRIARSRSVRLLHRVARSLQSVCGGLLITPTGFPLHGTE